MIGLDDTNAQMRANGVNAALEVSRARLVTALTNPRTPRQRDLDAVETLTSLAVGLGAQIELLVPEGRNKSIALTALEDVLIRANRGIYTEGGVKQ